MWLVSHVAVAVVYAGSCSSDSTSGLGPLAWEIPYATGMALKRKKKKRKRNYENHPIYKSIKESKISKNKIKDVKDLSKNYKILLVKESEVDTCESYSMLMD